MPVQLLDKRQKRVPQVDIALLEERCLHLLALLDLSYNTFCLAFISDARMAEYNRQYRGKNGPTNVLSFPAAFPAGTPSALRADLGDILIAVDTAKREAEEAGEPLERRLTELAIHGLLHLAGYDHERSESEACLMWDKEKSLLAALDSARRRCVMPALNVDLTPLIWPQRPGLEPTVLARLCELGGARGLIIQLTQDAADRPKDALALVRQVDYDALTLAIPATDACVALALDLAPKRIILTPEARTQARGGLDVAGRLKSTATLRARFADAGIEAIPLLAPDERQIQAAAKIGATTLMLHTGAYGQAESRAQAERELLNLRRAVDLALDAGLHLIAGHGLSYQNIGQLAGITGIDEICAARALAGRAVLTGLKQAVQDLLKLIEQGWYAGRL